MIPIRYLLFKHDNGSLKSMHNTSRVVLPLLLIYADLSSSSVHKFFMQLYSTYASTEGHNQDLCIAAFRRITMTYSNTPAF